VAADQASSLTSFDVRQRLVEALELDLVGPWPGHELEGEALRRRDRPSHWYLTGFLVPRNAPPEEIADADADDELGAEAGKNGIGDEGPPEPAAAKKAYYPSSMGLSMLLREDVSTLRVRVTWGDYVKDAVPRSDLTSASANADGGEEGQEEERSVLIWRRVPREQILDVLLSPGERTIEIPESLGLELHLLVRPVPTDALQGRIPRGTLSVSLFLVNGRRHDQGAPDERYVFQPELEIRSDLPFVPRPDLRGVQAGIDGWDEMVADLHYADVGEFATGHGVSADWDEVDGECRIIRTTWIPRVEVERTVTAVVPDVELGLEALGQLPDGAHAKAHLEGLVRHYRAWIAEKTKAAERLAGDRREVAEELLRRAAIAADRIERGVKVLETDVDALDAFRVANRAVASALRRRLKLASEPRWRPFQLAFILLNLPGLADPGDPDRETVDLLFFPTGGGKTEAYLGLAAFAIVLRRLRAGAEVSPDLGTGVTVIMRYTLRLLTLDQLGRAAGLMCALELEREKDPARYGNWPFEIGLWVGKAATPNVLGKKGDGKQDSARAKVHSFKEGRSKEMPIPIEKCPWCDTPFEPDSFNLVPNDDHPSNLVITCLNFECDFTGDRHLPIVAVDEPIYRRLPAFLVATVDKFASLPWTGASGVLLGGARRHDVEGFCGPTEPNRGKPLTRPLAPPDLIIQDELHLISGPLGTMAGLYETAIDALCTRQIGGREVKPKVIASTATVRRADKQVQALFARLATELFPPPGIDRRDSFFARVVPTNEQPGRLYLGLAAQGRSAKVLMRRTYLALMAAAEKAYVETGAKGNPDNPADPYMTILGYFNSLRELGGARRILEEEVRHTLREYGRRKRVGESEGLFRDRRRVWDVRELTSRISTDRVAEVKRLLELTCSDDGFVEAAVATNMISVGLDIPRLGLMVVMGQPKSHAEYIQATSRVGRDAAKPGLVVTLLNLAKPRDRSHYERFRHYHETFYRSVEVPSVTPFAARAIDRGFAGAMIALARHACREMTPPSGANEIKTVRAELEELLRQVFVDRVYGQDLEENEREAIRHRVESRIVDLLDSWVELKDHDAVGGVRLHYQKHEGNGTRVLLREMLENTGDPVRDKFRVNRSLRDVEPEVVLRVADLPVGWRARGGSQA